MIKNSVEWYARYNRLAAEQARQGTRGCALGVCCEGPRCLGGPTVNTLTLSRLLATGLWQTFSLQKQVATSCRHRPLSGWLQSPTPGFHPSSPAPSTILPLHRRRRPDPRSVCHFAAHGDYLVTCRGCRRRHTAPLRRHHTMHQAHRVRVRSRLAYTHLVRGRRRWKG